MGGCDTDSAGEEVTTMVTSIQSARQLKYFGWLLAIGWFFLAIARFDDFLHSRRLDLKLEYGFLALGLFLGSLVWAYRVLRARAPHAE